MPAQRIRRSVTLALAALLLSANLAAASTPPSVTVVESVATGAQSSYAMDASNSIAFNGWLYFSAQDGTHGYELWRTNGDTTELVRDINAGSYNSYPSFFYVEGDWLYFSADDGEHGHELWRTDGTLGGTTLVHNIFETSASLIPFAALPSPNFYTIQVRAIKSSGGAITVALEVYDNTSDPDATAHVTVTNSSSLTVIHDETFGSFGEFGAPGTHSSTFEIPCDLSVTIDVTAQEFSSAYIYLGDELLDSGGTYYGDFPSATRTGTVRCDPSSYPEPVGSLGGEVYVSAETTTTGRDLWSTDGSTLTLHEVAAGAASSSPTDGINFVTYLYFAATDESGERNVWRTDGTTTEVVYPGLGGIANPSDFVLNGTFLYVTENLGEPGTHPGRSLYKFTSALSSDVVNSGWEIDPDPQWTVSHNGTLYFTVDDGEHGRELWSSDGTPDRTKLVADLRVGAESSSPYFLTPFGDWLYFSADDGTHGRELYRTNGTTTTRITDIFTGGSSAPEFLTPLGSWLYFRAFEPTTGYTLYRTMGTTVQHVPMPSADLGINCDCYESAFTTLGSKLFFTVHSDSIGYEFAYLDEPSVALPETNRDTASWTIALVLLSAFTAVGGVYLCRQPGGQTSNK